MVSPGQRVERTASLIKLAQLSPLWVEIAVPASNIRAIRPGAKVEVDGYTTLGHVVLISETADAATQTILVRAEVPNNGELRPGQTAQALMGFASSAESAWELPYSALIRCGEQASVFVAVRGGFRLVAMTLLEEDQDHVVVSGPITEKDEVAASGISALRGILLNLRPVSHARAPGRICAFPAAVRRTWRRSVDQRWTRKAKVPGTKMTFAGTKDEQKIKDLISYLHKAPVKLAQ